MAKAPMGPITTGNIQRTFRAEGGDLTRGTAVIQGTADDQVKAPAAAGNRAKGIVAEDASQDKEVVVVEHGECIAIAGGAVNAGDVVKVGGVDGRLVASAAEDVEFVGFALSTAAADGDEFVLFVNRQAKHS